MLLFKKKKKQKQKYENKKDPNKNISPFDEDTAKSVQSNKRNRNFPNRIPNVEQVNY